MKKTGPYEVIELYNHMVALVCRKAGWLPSRKDSSSGVIGFGKTNLIKANKLLAVLSTWSILPGPYLASCFARHFWAYRPDLSKLLDQKYLDFYYEKKDEAFLWWKTIEQERQADEVPEVPIGREIIKKQYQAEKRYDLCQQKWITGGYNPKSCICQQCEKRKSCDS